MNTGRLKRVAHQGARTLIGVLFLSLAYLIVPIESGVAQDGDNSVVIELTIREIHEGLKDGTLTCESLVQAYLARVEAYDQATKLNSIVVVNAKALERARELDALYRSTGELLPLHGVPVVVKDNYDTFDLPTSGGSIALKDSIPPDDAYQVKRLREAGAIVFCKSNMAEWAYSPWFTVSSTAGVTRNPYDLTRVPAGSSGGTAAAVAACFGAVGLGTDTGNSIRGPSSHCCLVGIRPTQGLTSRDGIIPLFLRNDIGGPMCRTVEDAARVLEVIAGPDPNDPVTEKSREIEIDYVTGLDKQGLDGARIGVFRTLSETPTTDPEFKQLFESAIDDLRSQGAIIVDPFEIGRLDYRGISQLQGELWHDTFRHDIAEYLMTLGDDAPIKTLDDIMAYRDYGPFLSSRLSASKNSRIPVGLEKPYSADARDDPNRHEFLKRVVAAMERHRVDAFVFPTWNNPPRKIDDLDSPDGNNSYFISPPTGLPAITVPMGFDSNGLPAGLQFVGREFSEALLFKLAYSYEQSTQHRRMPSGFPSLGKSP